ncbi:MAG: NfeD family protein [Chthoniobacter sp.]
MSLGYIVPGTLLTAGFFLFVVGKGLRAQSLPARVGRESMLGRMAQAITAIDSQGGKVLFDGEYWKAVSDAPIRPGKPVEITAVEGLNRAGQTCGMQPLNPPTP